MLSFIPRPSTLIPAFHANAPDRLSPQKACRGVRRLRQQFSPLWRKYQFRGRKRAGELVQTPCYTPVLSQSSCHALPTAAHVKNAAKYRDFSAQYHSPVNSHRDTHAGYLLRTLRAQRAKIAEQWAQTLAFDGKCERSSRCE